MIENLYEQCVDNKSKSKTTVYTVLTVLGLIFIAIGVIFVVVGIRTDWKMMLFSLIFLPIGIVLWRKKDEAYSEYEYCFISGKIDVDKVINNKRRKSIVSFETSEIEAMGTVKSENFARHYSMPDAKKIKACFDLTLPNTYYATFVGDKGKVVLIFQPDETMLLSMKKYFKIRLDK